MTWIVWTNFVSRKLFIKFGYSWPSGFWEDDWNSHTLRIVSQKLKGRPWPPVLTNLHVLIKRTVYTLIFQAKNMLTFQYSLRIFLYLTLPFKKINFNKSHLFNNLGSSWVPKVTYQVASSLVSSFWRQKSVKVLTEMARTDILIMWLGCLNIFFISSIPEGYK